MRFPTLVTLAVIVGCVPSGAVSDGPVTGMASEDGSGTVPPPDAPPCVGLCAVDDSLPLSGLEDLRGLGGGGYDVVLPAVVVGATVRLDASVTGNFGTVGVDDGIRLGFDGPADVRVICPGGIRPPPPAANSSSCSTAVGIPGPSFLQFLIAGPIGSGGGLGGGFIDSGSVTVTLVSVPPDAGSAMEDRGQQGGEAQEHAEDQGKPDGPGDPPVPRPRLEEADPLVESGRLHHQRRLPIPLEDEVVQVVHPLAGLPDRPRQGLDPLKQKVVRDHRPLLRRPHRSRPVIPPP